MADVMFGAPAGIGAAERDMRENLLGGLKAQELIGEIGMQPAKMDMIQAHARLYKAQGAEYEAKTQEMLAFQNLMKGAGTPNAAPADASLATPLRSLADLAIQNGFVERGAKLAKDAALIDKRQSDIEDNESKSAVRDSTIRQRKVERIGMLAGAALQGDQANYDAVRLAAASEGLPMEDLPANFEAAKPELRRIFLSSLKAAEQLRAKQEEARQALQQRRNATANANLTQRTRLTDARIKLLDARRQQIDKALGPESPEAVEAKRALIKARETGSALREARLYPIPTPEELANNGKGLRVGQTYTTPKGRLTWNGTGFVQPPPTVPQATSATVKRALKNAGLDDEDDDEDEE